MSSLTAIIVLTLVGQVLARGTSLSIFPKGTYQIRTPPKFLSKDIFPTREPPPGKDARLKPERKYHTKAAVAIGKLKHNPKIGPQQMHGLLKRSGFTTKEIQAAWMEVAAEDETRKAEAVARDAAQKARTAARKVDPVTGFPDKTAETAQKVLEDATKKKEHAAARAKTARTISFLKQEKEKLKRILLERLQQLRKERKDARKDLNAMQAKSKEIIEEKSNFEEKLENIRERLRKAQQEALARRKPEPGGPEQEEKQEQKEKRAREEQQKQEVKASRFHGDHSHSIWAPEAENDDDELDEYHDTLEKILEKAQKKLEIEKLVKRKHGPRPPKPQWVEGSGDAIYRKYFPR